MEAARGPAENNNHSLCLKLSRPRPGTSRCSWQVCIETLYWEGKAEKLVNMMEIFLQDLKVKWKSSITDDEAGKNRQSFVACIEIH